MIHSSTTVSFPRSTGPRVPSKMPKNGERFLNVCLSCTPTYVSTVQYSYVIIYYYVRTVEQKFRPEPRIARDAYISTYRRKQFGARHPRNRINPSILSNQSINSANQTPRSETELLERIGTYEQLRTTYLRMNSTVRISHTTNKYSAQLYYYRSQH